VAFVSSGVAAGSNPPAAQQPPRRAAEEEEERPRGGLGLGASRAGLGATAPGLGFTSGGVQTVRTAQPRRVRSGSDARLRPA